MIFRENTPFYFAFIARGKYNFLLHDSVPHIKDFLILAFTKNFRNNIDFNLRSRFMIRAHSVIT